MTKTVNVHDAKTHLSKLLADVEAGDEVDHRPPRQAGGEDGPVRAQGRGRRWGSLKLPGPPIDDSVWDPMTDDELREWGLL